MRYRKLFVKNLSHVTLPFLYAEKYVVMIRKGVII